MIGKLAILFINSDSQILKNYVEIDVFSEKIQEILDVKRNCEEDNDRAIMAFISENEFPVELTNRILWNILILSKQEFEKLKDGHPMIVKFI